MKKVKAKKISNPKATKATKVKTKPKDKTKTKIKRKRKILKTTIKPKTKKTKKTKNKSVSKKGSKRRVTSLIKIKAVLKMLSFGENLFDACLKAKLGRSVFYKWLEDSKENKDLYYVQIGARDINIEETLYIIARGGNFPAISYYLNNRLPDKWKNKVENTIRSDPENPLTIKLANLSDEDLLKLSE